MAKRKGISISLAAKCQMLFGLAVLVIIAGALAVPWQRMEQLAGQPNVKAARYAADMLFRQIHAGASGVGSSLKLPPDASTPPAATQVAVGSGTQPSKGLGWNTVTLTDMDYARPRVLLVPGVGAD